MPEATTCVKIIPDPKGLYQGAFVADSPTKEDISNFEKMSGEKLDIVLKFLAFATGLQFPTNSAEAVAKGQGVIFIKLEPWSWKGAEDQSFSLQNLLQGKYDHLLERFAKGAKKFGKPIFVSFGHEMNGNWYPWAGNPKLYIKSYRYLHDKIESYGANNITWVWNPNVDFPFASYYPGSKYVDWVALDGYSWGGGKSAKAIFSSDLEQLKKYQKPMMIGEFGCGANSSSCITHALGYFTQQKLIKAYIYFNQNKEEPWAIDQPEEKKAYSEAMKSYRSLFIQNIQTKDCGPKTLEKKSANPTW